MNYSTTKINETFLIKVYGYDECGNRINRLVGVLGLITLIGIEMANKMLDRAFRCLEDKCVCKLRRGIKVTFYYH